MELELHLQNSLNQTNFTSVRTLILFQHSIRLTDMQEFGKNKSPRHTEQVPHLEYTRLQSKTVCNHLVHYTQLLTSSCVHCHFPLNTRPRHTPILLSRLLPKIEPASSSLRLIWVQISALANIAVQ